MVYAVVLTGFACSTGVEPASSSLEPPRHFTAAPVLYQTWSKTADLVRDPTTQKKVDALAALTLHDGIRPDGTMGPQWMIEAAAIGIDGGKSPAWVAFTDLARTLAPADAVALLRHESPAVRGYFARHVAHTRPSEAPELLYPLFGDATVVGDRSGCTASFTSIADLAFGELAYAGAETNLEREGLFAVIVEDKRIGVATRGKALAYVAELDKPFAHPLALAAAHDADPAWKQQGINALGLVGHEEDVELVAAGTTSADANEREKSATALGNIDGPASRNKLVPLLHDPDDDVRVAASRSYATQTCASEDVLAALLKDPSYGIASGVGRTLAHTGTLHALRILEPSLMDAQTPLGGFELESLLSAVGEPGIPVMRRLLSSRSSNVRNDAIHRLGVLDDQASIPAIRKGLTNGPSPWVAAEALGDLHAIEATDDLVGRLHDPNPNMRIACAKALVGMDAKRALPALEEAANTDSTFAKSELVLAASKLRSPSRNPAP